MRAASFNPHVATDGKGTWISLAYRLEAAESDSDIVISRGSTPFGPEVPIDPGAVSDELDDERPHVATDGAGAWIAVWTTLGALGADADVLVSRSTDTGGTWSAPVAIDPQASGDTGYDGSARLAGDGGGALGRGMGVERGPGWTRGRLRSSGESVE